VGEERQQGGEGALVVLERQWDLMRICGTSSLRRRHARRVLSRTVRGRGADRPEGRVTLHDVLYRNFFLYFNSQN